MYFPEVCTWNKLSSNTIKQCKCSAYPIIWWKWLCNMIINYFPHKRFNSIVSVEQHRNKSILSKFNVRLRFSLFWNGRKKKKKHFSFLDACKLLYVNRFDDRKKREETPKEKWIIFILICCERLSPAKCHMIIRQNNNRSCCDYTIAKYWSAMCAYSIC